MKKSTKTNILKFLDGLTYHKPEKSIVPNISLGYVSQQDLKKNKFTYQNKNQNYWADRACALACVAMIIKKPLNKKLLAQVFEKNGYNIKTDTGWYHKALVKVFLDHGINAKIVKLLTRKKIINFLKNGKIVMASVSGKLDSHMILIYGVKVENGKAFFIYHDPASKDNQKIEIDIFAKMSLFKGIVVSFK